MNPVPNWLPAGKRAAVVLSVDDVHPTPLADAAFDNLRRLQERHPQLRLTFFTTADWRSVAPFPDGRFLTRIPIVRDRVWSVPVLARGTYRVDRHEKFCETLRSWSGVEVAAHGLNHVRRGLKPITEFEGRSERACRALLRASMDILERARLPLVRGLCPPGWSAPPSLVRAMAKSNMRFLASSRDLKTPVTPEATTNGSGIQGVSLIYPDRLGDSLLHFATNFQANCTLDRANAIIDHGGLLAIKAHLLAGVGTYKALDGLTPEYCAFLDGILSAIEDRYGDSLWWTSMGEIACA